VRGFPVLVRAAMTAAAMQVTTIASPISRPRMRRGQGAPLFMLRAVEQEPEPAGIGDDQHRIYQQERTQMRLKAGPREDQPGYEREEDAGHQAQHPGRPISTPQVDYRGAAQAGVSHVISVPPVGVYEMQRANAAPEVLPPSWDEFSVD